MFRERSPTSANYFLKRRRQTAACTCSNMAATTSAPLPWTHPRHACAFSSSDLFMIGRGVSYYGAYVCTAQCLPVIKARGCQHRITVQRTKDADGNPCMPSAKLHRTLLNRQRPRNTASLPRLAGKVFREVIFSRRRLTVSVFLLKELQGKQNSLKPWGYFVCDCKLQWSEMGWIQNTFP